MAWLKPNTTDLKLVVDHEPVEKPNSVAPKPGLETAKPKNGTVKSYEYQSDHQELKSRVHNQLLDVLDFSALCVYDCILLCNFIFL